MSWLDRVLGRAGVMNATLDQQIEARTREERAHLRAAEEQRAITSLPWNVGGSLPSMAQTSPTRALTLAPVYGAVSMIARSIAALPLHGYRKTGPADRVRLPQLPQLFQGPSIQGELTDWLHRLLISLLMHGNAYGLITERDGFGFPTMIEWLDPMQVWVVDQNLWGRGSFWDPIIYWRGREVERTNLVHIPWFSVPFRFKGLSPLADYAAAVDLGLGGQRFVTDWYDAGGVPPGRFQNKEKKVTDDEAKEIRGRLTTSIRQHEPLVYGADWSYDPITINPVEAHFVQSHQLSATDIAVVYGIYPPERIGGVGGRSMTYANVEAEQIQWVNITLLPYVTKLESHFFGLLPQPQYVKFDLDSQIRSDTRTRHEVYQIDRQIGLTNVDELRAKEDLPPVPNGEGKDYAPLVVVREMIHGEPSASGVNPNLAPNEQFQAPPPPGGAGAPAPPLAPSSPSPNGQSTDAQMRMYERLLEAAETPEQRLWAEQALNDRRLQLAGEETRTVKAKE